jgi:hypothetical protein
MLGAHNAGTYKLAPLTTSWTFLPWSLTLLRLLLRQYWRAMVRCQDRDIYAMLTDSDNPVVALDLRVARHNGTIWTCHRDLCVPLAEVKDALQRAGTNPIVFVTPDWAWRTRVSDDEYTAATREAFKYLKPLVDARSAWSTSTMRLGLFPIGKHRRLGDGVSARFDVADIAAETKWIAWEIGLRITVPVAITVAAAYRARAYRGRRLRWRYLLPVLVVLLPVLVVLFDLIPPITSPFANRPTVTAVENTVSLQDFV